MKTPKLGLGQIGVKGKEFSHTPEELRLHRNAIADVAHCGTARESAPSIALHE